MDFSFEGGCEMSWDDEFTRRETKKAEDYIECGHFEELSDIKLFRKIMLHRWRGIGEAVAKPTQYEFYTQFIRGNILLGEVVSTDILKAYPPATGLLKVIPGGTESI
jgi:hypothetical protein